MHTGTEPTTNLGRIQAAVHAAAPALLATLRAVQRLCDVLEMPPGPDRAHTLPEAIGAAEQAIAGLAPHRLPYLLAGCANDARRVVAIACQHRGPDRAQIAVARAITERLGGIIRQSASMKRHLADG